MTVAFATAADVLANQGVRDAAIPVLQAFQAASQSNSNVPYSAAEIQTLVSNLSAALIAAGASTSGSATAAVVANGATVAVKNSAGTTVAGTHTAEVAASALTDVKLASTVAPLVSGVKVSVTAGSGSGNFATPTIVNGVITALVLSAS